MTKRSRAHEAGSIEAGSSKSKSIFFANRVDGAVVGQPGRAKSALDPPSLIQPGPGTKFDDTLLGVTSRRILSRHVASLRFTSLCFAFFCVFFANFRVFFAILALKTEVFGGNFSIHFGC